MTRSSRLAVLGAALSLAVALSGCRQGIDYIQVTPDVVTFKNRNEEEWLRAMPKSHTGTEYPKINVGWSVKDPSVATIDGTGKLHPVKSGRTEVVASIGDVKAVVPVEIILIEKMKVEPELLVLKEDGEPRDFKVKFFDYLGRELRDRKATFSSSDKKVVTLAEERAFPGSRGTAKVEIRAGELRQVVEVKVEK
ncbi:MAG: hypothetical protein WBV82_33350 [Myxococcaceae bacterium]